MAQTINTTLNNGLFKADKLDFDVISENKLIADLSGCMDEVAVLVDLSGMSGNVSFDCLSSIGKAVESIPLTAGVVNVFRITTHGIKTADGTANFAIKSDSSVANAGVRVAFLKYVSVINN